MKHTTKTKRKTPSWHKPVVGSKWHDLEWFLSNVGERVFRGEVRCDCDTCKRGTKEGILITDKTHANYLFDVQNELGIRYHATGDGGAVAKGVSGDCGEHDHEYKGDDLWICKKCGDEIRA